LLLASLAAFDRTPDRALEFFEFPGLVLQDADELGIEAELFGDAIETGFVIFFGDLSGGCRGLLTALRVNRVARGLRMEVAFARAFTRDVLLFDPRIEIARSCRVDLLASCPVRECATD
jgi:hypothetical protein